MDTINVDENKYTDNPYNTSCFNRYFNNDCVKKISDVEMFIDGFRQLCEKTKMKSVTHTRIGIVTNLNFEDGTSVGIKRLFNEIGFDI